MIKQSVSRVVGLFFVLALISTTCGWLPFQADFTIHSVPEGAAVYKAGEDRIIGTTPYQGHIFHFDHNYEVRLEGFYDQKILVDYNAAEDIYVKLRALPVLICSKPDADIYAADAVKPFGKTPLEVDVFHEDRTYTLKAKDYFDKKITVGMATETPMVIELDRRPIITLTAADGVEIYENDELLATTTMTEEILTNRTFVLKKEGYYDKTIELTSTSPTDIDVELVPLPIITIQTTPADATVYLVGQDAPLGKGDLTLTIDQETSFEVKADRYYSETFTVEPKTQTAEVKLVAMPYVTITSAPAGADVLLDGKLLGTTPLEQLIEKETTYELRREGYLPQKITLNGKDPQPVVAMKTASVTEEVEKAVVEPVEEVEEAVVEPAEVVEEPAEQGMNLPLIGGIAAAVLAVIIAIVLAKKKKA